MLKLTFLKTFRIAIILTISFASLTFASSVEQFIIKDSKDIASLFPQSIEELVSNLEVSKNNAHRRLQKIIDIPFKERTFENTILEYDRAYAEFRIYGSILGTLKMVHPDKEVCLKAKEVLSEWTDCMIDLFKTNQDIYHIFKDFQARSNEYLNEERQYYLNDTISSFKRAGLELPSQQYLSMKDLQKQIALLSLQFSTNIAQDTPTFNVDLEEINGLDDHFINSLARAGEKYIIKCDSPTGFQIMMNCSVEATRKKYLYLHSNRAFPQNVDVINDLINTRHDLACLLGYNSYADFDVATEMAQSLGNVEKFLDDLALKSYPRIIANWNYILKELPETVTLTNVGKIKAWDVAFIKNQYMNKHFHIDQNEISKYFPMEKTIRNLLNVYEKFFNLQFQVINNTSYWNEPVQVIEVRQNASDQSLIGYVLLDLFPRENKFSHCCCNSIIPPRSFDHGKSFEPALAVVIANFSKSTKNNPSLLKHHEVKTFFHEFGHAIHALLGRAEMPTKGAYNTKTDFIETPSQLLEEWMWDYDILKMISNHYHTGKPLSDSNIQDLIKTRNFFDAAHRTTGGNSDHIGTELVFAKLSLYLFKEGKDKDLSKIYKEIYDSTPQIVAYDIKFQDYCAFNHLTNYGAKYYSYPWSKQMALKIFNYIKANGGLLDPIMGERYITKIIGRGGSCDPSILMADFLEN